MINTNILQGKRILVAEDTPSNQVLMEAILEELECHADFASDGEEALEKYNQNTYDLIIVDVHMPRKDGYEFAREIRKLESTTGNKHMLLLALTANAMVGEQEKCLNAGMDDYMSKPIEINSFERKLIDLFRRFPG